MGSYYYTEADKALVEEIAIEYRERLLHDPAAKRGKHWRLDGEVVSWDQLMREINGGGEANPEIGKWRKELQALTRAGGFDSPRYRSLRKLGNMIPFQGLLKLLQERLAYWQGADAPF